MAKHGTVYSYDVKKCRCDLCKRAASEKRKRFIENSKEIRHGTTFGYNEQKCRCDLCKEAASIASQRYRKNFPEKRLAERSREDPALRNERSKRYYRNHPERVIASNESWQEKNPEKWTSIQKAVHHRRRARRAGNPGSHTGVDILEIYEFQQGVCRWCAQPVYDCYHIDHVMLVALGGSEDPENLVISCPTCNREKGAIHPDVWMSSLRERSHQG